MAILSKRSLERLATCHQDLQDICHELIKITDFSVICGYRGEEEQNQAFSIGASKLKFPQSKHNSTPSMAVDIAPWQKDGIDWNNHTAFKELANKFKTIAKDKGILVEWGGDWKMVDMPHMQLKDK